MLSLGLYRHRKAVEPGFPIDLSLQRQTAYHTRFLEEVLKSGSQVEVAWNIQDVRNSLQFLVKQAGLRGTPRTAEIVARLFEATEDAEVRELCLASLDQINSPGAQRQLLYSLNGSSIPSGELSSTATSMGPGRKHRIHLYLISRAKSSTGG